MKSKFEVREMREISLAILQGYAPGSSTNSVAMCDLKIAVPGEVKTHITK